MTHLLSNIIPFFHIFLHNHLNVVQEIAKLRIKPVFYLLALGLLKEFIQG